MVFESAVVVPAKGLSFVAEQIVTPSREERKNTVKTQLED